jgi:hypothetical protein
MIRKEEVWYCLLFGDSMEFESDLLADSRHVGWLGRRMA